MENFNRFFYGEAGEGDYGQTFGPLAQSCIEPMMERILEAVASIPVNSLKEKEVFTVADYGTADGFASLPLMVRVIETLRQKHQSLPIQIVYEDQASSDFVSLFKRLYGLIPDATHSLQKFQDLYIMASGTSFFQQILPDNSAHLITSFLAAHYLSKPAVKFQNSLERFPDATETERQLVEAQAAKDWQTFLLHRAKELKSGGVLVVSMPGEDSEERIEGVRVFAQNIVAGMPKVWRQMRDEGKITKEEFVETNFYRCMPTLGEMTAPFAHPDSPVIRAGLKLVHAETVLSPCVELLKWKKKLAEEGVDDRVGWSRGVVSLHKYWFTHAFMRGLASTRSPQDKEDVMKELHCRLEEEILATGPTQAGNYCVTNFVFVRKV